MAIYLNLLSKLIWLTPINRFKELIYAKMRLRVKYMFLRITREEMFGHSQTLYPKC